VIGVACVRHERIAVSSLRTGKTGSRAALFVSLIMATVSVAELILRLW